jgi:hypothetical protein
VTKALHPPALVVHRHQQVRFAQAVDLRHQLLQLLRRFVVAGKQDYTAHQRVAQHVAFLGTDFQASEVEHEGAK